MLSTSSLPHHRFWAIAVLVAAILFSSTAVAGKWADRTFDSLAVFLLAVFADYTPSYGTLHLFAEKAVHLTLFCTFGILLWNARPARPVSASLVLLSGAVLGALSEFLQRFFPARDPLISDVLLNISGTALGIPISLAASRFKRFSLAIFRIKSSRIFLCNR